MSKKVVKLDANDNVLIALADLRKGAQVPFGSELYTLASDVPAKHKFAMADLPVGASVWMYSIYYVTGSMAYSATSPSVATDHPGRLTLRGQKHGDC